MDYVEWVFKAVNNSTGLGNAEDKAQYVRQVLAQGLEKKITEMVKNTCISWQNKDYTELMDHAIL